MADTVKINVVKKDSFTRIIPNIIEHRIANLARIDAGKNPIDFWDTVPVLLALVEKQAKKKNKPVHVMKEQLELILTIAAVKGIEYVY